MKIQITFIALLTSVLFISSCEKDPCDDVKCLNGGYCDNGNCNCAPGYTGDDCGTMIIPESMTIIKVTINDFVNNPGNNQPWDPTSLPDIYVTINKGTSANHSDVETGYYKNASFGNQYYFDVSKTIYDLSDFWIVGLWDYDTQNEDYDNNDDYMGGIYFAPMDNIKGLPSTLVLYNDSSPEKKYTLTVEWNY